MKTKYTAAQIARLLGLKPLLPEGGMFCSTYRSCDKNRGRETASAIYYLLESPTFSHMHRLDADELYHFYMGDAVELLLLGPNDARRVVLGQDLLAGQQPQVLVPAGCWQGAHLLPGGQWALMGTTMSPAFEDACYEHACAEELCAAFPDQRTLISQLTTSR
ncbi:MAG: cupin domain-containing protein [Ruminococcaceae bacterium]|nr:cupin domain-containing protein [Oscillospiraceae bacterium]